MTSKELILQNIRKNNVVKNEPLPVLNNFGITYQEKFEQFSIMLESVGGHSLIVKKEELDSTIKEIYPDEKNIATNVEYCNIGNFNANDEDDPHNLRNIDLAVVKGEFAVAENGAVWVKNSENRHRSLYFIAQNIVLVVDKNSLLNNMHEAYDLISFQKSTYGAFVSGPSKTADIEQSLVIGAHGPKSGYIIFVE